MTSRTIDSQLELLLLPPEPGDFDEGGQGPQISKETVEKTTRYIDKIKQTLSREKGVDLGNPYRIMRDSKGGVDVEWRKNEEYGALMNVSAEGDASYYWRRDDGSNDLKGNLEL